ncbi:hypothetical protein ACFO6V_12735 [Promicromonospora alba]|uniref:Secreted protein n=1 Tax=Promicromonospora alba TaxID=1616110 RepID=A0ABV9HJS6_9MICO
MITTPRKPWGRRTMALVTALTLALPATAAAAAPAPAAPAVAAAPASSAGQVGSMATACPGSRIVHKPIKVGRRTVAWLNVFHDRGSGIKCAETAHTGPSWGRWAYTEVDIWTRSGSSSVGGDYRYRTGPASIGGANGVCVGARGTIEWRGAMRVTTVHQLCG